MKHNILLVVLDSVRARNTSLHGYERDTTPFLTEFAERSTVYEQARAPGVGSPQSHTSMFTGFHVHEHFINSTNSTLLPGYTVWEELAAGGYDTGLFSSNSYLTGDTIGLNDTFETVAGIDSRLPFPEGLDPREFVGGDATKYVEFIRSAKRQGTVGKSLVNGLADEFDWADWVPYSFSLDGRTYTDAFSKWMQARSGPWAACINYMDAHSPFEPRPEHNNWGKRTWDEIQRDIDDVLEYVHADERPAELAALEDLYDDCIHQADSEVRRLIQQLERTGEREDTLVVITSDHGEGFGESGTVRNIRTVLHGTNGGIEEEILHVPLLVSFPRQDVGTVEKSPASLTAFRSVVDAVNDGDYSRDGFVPDDAVLSSALGLSDAERSAIPPGFDIPRSYENESQCVYRSPNSDEVIKYAVAGERDGRFDCSDPQATTYLDAETGSVIADSFGKLRQSDAVRHEKKVLRENVYERLEQLGYR